MNGIGIVGAGIAGLHLGLLLRKHGVAATIYTEKSADELRASRALNLVARFDHTRARERALGVDHWDAGQSDMFCVSMYVGGPQPLAFRGEVSQPYSGIDFRIYLSTLLEDFEARGGRVVVGAVQAGDVECLAEQHDLVVVSSGRGSLTELFPRVPERSPYTQPQRRLCGGFYRGVRFPDPLGVSYNISPGHGEIFDAQFLTFDGRRTTILVEAVPGGNLEAITYMRYEDDRQRFLATLLDLLRAHAPLIYDRVDPHEFDLVRPIDVVQGAITPTVRRGYRRLSNGKFAVAVGDVHMVNDPVLGQGANTASATAWILGEAILEAGCFDEQFCQDAEQRIWEWARYPTEWTNVMLQPPAPHAIDLLVAATQSKHIADEIIDNFNAPQRNWEIFTRPEGAAAFLQRHQWQAAPAALAA